MDINKLRSQIPATQNVVYMNTGWSGPSPTAVVDAIVKRLEIESSLGPASPQVLASGRETRQDLREALASYLHVRPSELTLTQNTTEGQNIVINGLDWKSGDEVITFNLEQAGFRTITACNAHEALEELQQHTPDVIVSDIMMPGTDGIDFCRAVRSHARWSEIPLIFITFHNCSSVNKTNSIK